MQEMLWSKLQKLGLAEAGKTGSYAYLIYVLKNSYIFCQKNTKFNSRISELKLSLILYLIIFSDI